MSCTRGVCLEMCLEPISRANPLVSNSGWLIAIYLQVKWLNSLEALALRVKIWWEPIATCKWKRDARWNMGWILTVPLLKLFGTSTMVSDMSNSLSQSPGMKPLVSLNINGFRWSFQAWRVVGKWDRFAVNKEDSLITGAVPKFNIAPEKFPSK